ncbi:MAG TPA: CRTAC1 family protein [Bacteroidota bacterium]|nr:CRTAC1 family protein [Bacteroidota bacterium]
MKKIILILFSLICIVDYYTYANLIEIKNDNGIAKGIVYSSDKNLWEESTVLIPDGPCSVKTIRIYFSGSTPAKDTIWVCGFPTAGNLWPTEYIWSYNSLINPIIIDYSGTPGWMDIDVSTTGLRSDGIDKIVIQHRMKSAGPYFTYDSDGKSSAMSWYTDPFTPNPNFYNIAGTLYYTPPGDYMLRLIVEYDFPDGDRSDPPPQPKFTNMNAEMGISAGSEISIVDYNQDGWDDIAIRGNIYKNDYANSNKFINVSSELGIGSAAGTNWADFDNDGRIDVYVMRNGQFDFDKRMVLNQDRIYKNCGDSGFVAIPNDQIFMKPYPNPSIDFSLSTQFENNDYFNPYNTCTPFWLDYNSDGLPDLFIANKRIEISGQPEIYTPDEIWLNIGDGKFVNKRSEANLKSGEPYIPGSSGNIGGYYDCYGAAACDYNNDNLTDIFVATYRLAPDNLYKNLGNGSFTDVGPQTGAEGIPTAAPYYFGHGMGCSWGDFNNDGWFDLCVGNLAHTDSRGLYSNPSLIFQNLGGEGKDKFNDVHYQMGLKFHEGNAGACWVDLDNDGWLDLWHGKYSGGYGTFYLNQGQPDYKLKDITWLINTFINEPWEGVRLDFDNDGDEDMLIKGYLMRNDLPHKGNWVELRLKGKPDDGVSMDALGTKVAVWANNRAFYRELYGTAAGTHSTQNSSCLHFGIGNADLIDSIIIQYPNKQIHKLTNIKPNAIYYIDYMQNPAMKFIATPALQYPENYSINLPTNITLEWSRVEGAESYIVEIYPNKNLTSGDTITVLDAKNSQEIQKKQGDIVFWRVRAKGNQLTSAYSSLWSFVVGSPSSGKLQLIEPANNAKNIGTSVTFRWNKPTFPQINFYPNIDYRLQLSTNSDFSTILYDNSSIRDTSIYITGIFQPATQIFWRVKPIIEKDTNQEWSDIFNFTTLSLPNKIELIAPPNYATDVDVKGGFNWKEDELAEYYWAQVAKDVEFQDIVLERQGVLPPFNAMPRLKEGTTYFWHVAGTNAAGVGPWSDTWQFTTKKGSDINQDKIIENAYMYLEVGSNEAHIKIQGAQNKKCTIILTNLFGIELMKIYDGILDFNDMNITFNVQTLSSGTYFCIIKIEDNQKILKFNMTK